jgi:mannose-6-phosphate isomerase-like protein (cupin superfamily)
MERKDFILTSLMAGFATTGFSQTIHSEPNKKTDPFYIPPNPEPLISHEGTLLRLKVRSKQTDGNVSCAESSIAPKTMGPSPHVHKDLDELMFVHEGTMTVMVGTEIYEVKAGGYLMRPHGIIHSFWNSTDEPAHFTDFFFNQNFDDFIEELFFKIIPELKAQGLKLNSPEGLKRRVDLDKRFDVTSFPEKRKAIVDKYGLTGTN